MNKKQHFSLLLILSSLLTLSCSENSEIHPDLCPNNANKTAPGICGCDLPDPESDQNGDGKIDLADCLDLCPDDSQKIAPGVCGCGVADADNDNDTIPDCHDLCPNDPQKREPGICGCGIPEADCLHVCVDSPVQKLLSGVCGCDVDDTDSDGDTLPDCKDQCPDDPQKIAPGVCGCGVDDADSDNDTIHDCLDLCPNDPQKIVPGVCGCGVADSDNDNDTIPDCHDACPFDPDRSQKDECPFYASDKCEPERKKCDGNQIMVCNEDGSGWHQASQCNDGEECHMDGDSPACIQRNQGVCLKRSDNGKYFSLVADGYKGCDERSKSILSCENGKISQTLCKDDERCIDAQCQKNVMCGALVSGTKYCSRGNLYVCDNGQENLIENCLDAQKICHMEKLSCVVQTDEMCSDKVSSHVMDASDITCINDNGFGRIVQCQTDSKNVETLKVCGEDQHGMGYCLGNDCQLSACNEGYHIEKDDAGNITCKENAKYSLESLVKNEAYRLPNDACAEQTKTTLIHGVIDATHQACQFGRTAYLTDLTGTFLQSSPDCDNIYGLYVECNHKTSCVAPNLDMLFQTYALRNATIENDRCHLMVKIDDENTSTPTPADPPLQIEKFDLATTPLTPTSDSIDTLVDIVGTVKAVRYIGETSGYDVPWGWEVETANGGQTLIVVGILNGLNDYDIKISMESGKQYSLTDGILTYRKGRAVFAPRALKSITLHEESPIVPAL